MPAPKKKRIYFRLEEEECYAPVVLDKVSPSRRDPRVDILVDRTSPVVSRRIDHFWALIEEAEKLGTAILRERGCPEGEVWLQPFWSRNTTSGRV